MTKVHTRFAHKVFSLQFDTLSRDVPLTLLPCVSIFIFNLILIFRNTFTAGK